MRETRPVAPPPEEYPDVGVLIRHHLEQRGHAMYAAEPPERLGSPMEMSGYTLTPHERGVDVTADFTHTILHHRAHKEATLSLPTTLSRKAISSGLVWWHPLHDEARAIYIVDVLGELFVGHLTSKTHVLSGGDDTAWLEAPLEALLALCARHDPWLHERMDMIGPRRWVAMIALGELIRHVMAWTEVRAREQVHGVLSRWREGLSPRQRDILRDEYTQRLDHLFALLDTPHHGALLRVLRADLEAASALCEWLGLCVERRLLELDAHVCATGITCKRVPPVEPRQLLLSPDAWWLVGEDDAGKT